MSIELNGGIMTGVLVHYSSRNISRTSQEGLRESWCLMVVVGKAESIKLTQTPDPSPLLSRIICRWKDLQIPLRKKGIYKYRSWKLRTSGQDWNQKQAHLISGIRKSEYWFHPVTEVARKTEVFQTALKGIQSQDILNTVKEVLEGNS